MHKTIYILLFIVSIVLTMYYYFPFGDTPILVTIPKPPTVPPKPVFFGPDPAPQGYVPPPPQNENNGVIDVLFDYLFPKKPNVELPTPKDNTINDVKPANQTIIPSNTVVLQEQINVFDKFKKWITPQQRVIPFQNNKVPELPYTWVVPNKNTTENGISPDVFINNLIDPSFDIVNLLTGPESNNTNIINSNINIPLLNYNQTKPSFVPLNTTTPSFNQTLPISFASKNNLSDQPLFPQIIADYIGGAVFGN